jgi:hypothetical protein
MLSLTNDEILSQIQMRAAKFFWEKADDVTGLVNDRAKNAGEDNYDVASIASTGYALSALPISVQHGWTSNQDAHDRALKTLRYIYNQLPHQNGWFFHFVDKRKGTRVWNSELSSIDTSILIAGALVCGQFFPDSEIQQLANKIYQRIDWLWMLTNGEEQPDKLLLSHGWKPESGFLPVDWDSYCELMLIYLLGMGADKAPLPSSCWHAWMRPVIEYKGYKTLCGGPIFVHQMAHGFYDFSNQRDTEGWNYWISSREASLINWQYCQDQSALRQTYNEDIWGLNAGDYPGGYKAFAAPGDEDGTVSPTGAVSSIMFVPDLSARTAQAMYSRYGHYIWGQYGFANGFNIDQNWYDDDVIGIDLGMALLAIENVRSGLIWNLLASHPSTSRAWNAAGFHTDYDSKNLKK